MTRPLRLPPFPLQSPTTGFAYSSILELSLARGSGCRRAAPQLEVISVCRIPILEPPQAVTQWLETWRAAVVCGDGRTDMITGSRAVAGRTMSLRRRLHRLTVILRDVAAVGVQNVHVMHLTSREAIFRGVDPLLLARQALRCAGEPRSGLCSSTGQTGEANGGVGERLRDDLKYIRRGRSHVRQARGVPVRHGSIRRPPAQGRL